MAHGFRGPCETIGKGETASKTYVHLVDSLVVNGISIKKVFAPEHGFRGRADAGEKVEDGIDLKTGLPIISLYGKNKKPTQEQLDGLDVHPVRGRRKRDLGQHQGPVSLREDRRGGFDRSGDSSIHSTMMSRSGQKSVASYSKRARSSAESVSHEENG